MKIRELKDLVQKIARERPLGCQNRQCKAKIFVGIMDLSDKQLKSAEVTFVHVDQESAERVYRATFRINYDIATVPDIRHLIHEDSLAAGQGWHKES